jgi:hypothetical protein
MNEENESQEMKDFKKKWIGKSVRVVDKSHPHYNVIGDVSNVEKTPVGFGMKIKNTQNDSIFYGEEFFVFKGNQIELN